MDKVKVQDQHHMKELVPVDKEEVQPNQLEFKLQVRDQEQLLLKAESEAVPKLQVKEEVLLQLMAVQVQHKDLAQV